MIHPTYYEGNAIKLEAIDVMDYLHPALANAFKYLVRAGAKPDNSWESDAKKALTYLAHYQSYKDTQPELPEAYFLLNLFCKRSVGLLNTIIKKSHDIESFVSEAEKYLNKQLYPKK